MFRSIPFTSRVLCVVLSVATLVVAVLSTGSAAASETILDCDFESKRVGQVIATGGAAANEPVDLDGIVATVRAAPLPTRCLEIGDNSTTLRKVRFEFLDDVEIDSGVFEVSMTVQFFERDVYQIGLRPHGGASSPRFVYLTFSPPGNVGCLDLDTLSGTPIATYVAGVPYAIRITIDLDARTYDLSFAGNLLLDDESLGDFTGGIGSIWIEMGNDPDTDGVVFLDDLLVTATMLSTPVESTSWGAVKARWR